MDSNKTAGEEARRQLNKNAASNIEQVLAATPHKTPTVRPPASITKIIQVRRTKHAGHCWRSRDELISDVLLWTPTHVRAKAGWPARTYIQPLCEDTGCCPDDLPEAMNDKEMWRERVRDIRATSTTWWWWWLVWLAWLKLRPKCFSKAEKTFTINNHVICLSLYQDTFFAIRFNHAQLCLKYF